MGEVIAATGAWLCLAALATLAGVGAFIGHARRRSWVAAVSARSSHQQPTPTGAGLVFAVVATLVTLGLVWQGHLARIWLLWSLAALSLSLLGWLDDRRGLSAGSRLLVQCLVVAAWSAGVLAQHDALPAGLLWLLWLAGVLAQAWFINLFNFMDGLDGFAASEALFVWLAWIGLSAAAPGAGLAGLVQVAVLAGFLAWNLPPAKVFMGDAGSLFLGFALSAPLWLSGGTAVAVWVILVAVFVTDASLTLAWRAWCGEPLASAHRAHLYQALARRLGGHRPVLALLLAVNLLWLLPLAWVASRQAGLAWAMAGVAYGGLGLAWWAGRAALARRPAG